jgi:hypothetical protein
VGAESDSQYTLLRSLRLVTKASSWFENSDMALMMSRSCSDMSARPKSFSMLKMTDFSCASFFRFCRSNVMPPRPDGLLSHLTSEKHRVEVFADGDKIEFSLFCYANSSLMALLAVRASISPSNPVIRSLSSIKARLSSPFAWPPSVLPTRLECRSCRPRCT